MSEMAALKRYRDLADDTDYLTEDANDHEGRFLRPGT